MLVLHFWDGPYRSIINHKIWDAWPLTRQICGYFSRVSVSLSLSQWRRNEFESVGGGTSPARSVGKFGRALYFITISRFGERFCDGQYSLVSFLFAVLLVTVPLCPMESAPLLFNKHIIIILNGNRSACAWEACLEPYYILGSAVGKARTHDLSITTHQSDALPLSHQATKTG